MEITFGTSIVGLLNSYPLITNFSIISGAINIAFAQLLMGGSAFILYLKISSKSRKGSDVYDSFWSPVLRGLIELIANAWILYSVVNGEFFTFINRGLLNEKKRSNKCLWTGGYDSSFRMVQLSKSNVMIQPYYLSDKRKCEKMS